MPEEDKLEEFTCARCGIKLRTERGVAKYICPACDFENDVQERLMSEHIKKDGLASIIKYEGDGDTLVWKHPIEDFNYGTQLIVHENQEAIFFRDGQALDLFGAGRYTLETQQLPMLEKVCTFPADVERVFHSEIYYINLSTVMGVKWGTDSKVRMFDPASGLHVELGACGEFNIRVVNSRMLLTKLVGTKGNLKQEQILGIGDGKGFFRAMIMTQVKSYLAKTIKECGINILEIDERLMELSEELRIRLNCFLQNYGLEMPEFFVSRIVTPDDDPDFKRMKQQYADQYLLIRQEQIKRSEAEAAQARKAVEAQTEAQMKIIEAQGKAEVIRIQKQAEADAYRMQAEAEATEMHLKGYTYQQETARQVGLGATKAMANGGSGSGIGEIANLGMTLGAMGSVIGMTKDAMDGITAGGSSLGQTTAATIAGANTWDCPNCGNKNISTKFCPECGTKREG
jgi:membrane protease subunit (stomatin/prohibitin family)